MPRKRRVSGSKKKPREPKEKRALRSGRKDSEESSSSGSTTPERMDETVASGAEQTAMKLAPIFEKMQTTRNTVSNTSPDGRPPRQEEGKENNNNGIGNIQQQLLAEAMESLGRREDEEPPGREGLEYPNVDSIRKRLFDSGDSADRESRNKDVDPWKIALKEMEERIVKNQIESEARIKRANMEAHDKCRRDMKELINAEEEKMKTIIDDRVRKAVTNKSDRKENEELKLKINRLETAIEKIIENIRIGVEHQAASQFQIDKSNEKIKSLEELVTKKDKEIAALNTQSEISDQYTRKLNLWIYGLPGNDKTPEDTLKRVQDFVINDLGADRKAVENWDIRNIHRVPNDNNDPNPIIVSFLKWKDKDFLLRTGKELRGYNEGKKHWVSFKHDLCKGSRAARKSMGIEATSIRENQQLLARVCDNAKGQVWLQTKKRKEDNWKTVKSYKP